MSEAVIETRGLRKEFNGRDRHDAWPSPTWT